MKADIDAFSHKPWKATGKTGDARLMELRRAKVTGSEQRADVKSAGGGERARRPDEDRHQRVQLQTLESQRQHCR